MLYTPPFGFEEMVESRKNVGKTYFIRTKLFKEDEVQNLHDYLYSVDAKRVRSSVPLHIFNKIIGPMAARIDKFVIEFIIGYSKDFDCEISGRPTIAPYMVKVGGEPDLKFQVRLPNELITEDGSRASAIIALISGYTRVYSDMSWNSFEIVPMCAGDMLVFDNDLWISSPKGVGLYFEYLSGKPTAEAIFKKPGP